MAVKAVRWSSRRDRGGMSRRAAGPTRENRTRPPRARPQYGARESGIERRFVERASERVPRYAVDTRAHRGDTRDAPASEAAPALHSCCAESRTTSVANSPLDVVSRDDVVARPGPDLARRVCAELRNGRRDLAPPRGLRRADVRQRKREPAARCRPRPERRIRPLARRRSPSMAKLVESKRNASMARAARRPRAPRDRRTESITTRYAARPSLDDSARDGVAENAVQRRARTRREGR